MSRLTLFKISSRGQIAFAHDIVMAAAAFLISLYLRLGDQWLTYFPKGTLLLATATFTGIAAAAFLLNGLYRGVWRYVSLNDMLAIARATTVTILVFILVMFLWTRLEATPRSVPFINWFVLAALLGGPWFLYRAFKDRRLEFKLESQAERQVPVLLVGAGDGAELFLRVLRRGPRRMYRVLGILAEKQKRVGHRIHEVPVLGTVADLVSVADQFSGDDRPQRVILTKDTMDGAKVRALLDDATRLGMILARLPRLTDFKSGIDDAIEVRPVALEDLLGRPQTPLDRDSMRAMVEDRRVLITGAGGSIGAELVRRVSAFGPAEMVLLDSSEFNLYTIDQEVWESHAGLAAPAVLADVRDRDRIARLFAGYRPEVVFHAAALKHVPLVEANPLEGMETNIPGTVNVADACVSAGTAAMVLISTDKAVNPTSVMGATKRLAQMYCQAMDVRRGGSDGTRFLTVRFGNVLGSTGSVVPLFQKQIAQGGPVTVTDPEMRRYFMTIREAVELVLQASALGLHGSANAGKIFVLDMGEPVKIVDLARQMIRSLNPDAKLIETSMSRVPLDKVLNTGRFDHDKAQEHPLWFKELLSYDFCRLPRQRGATARHAIWRAAAGVGSREAGPPLAPCRSGIAPVFISCPERIPGFTARMTRRGSG